MKIAVMGSAPSSVRLGPYMDESWAKFQQGKNQSYPPAPHLAEKWDIWGCSPGLFGYAQRATRWFEVHRWEPGQAWFSPEYCQFLREFNGPVYVGRPIEEIKNHVVYPLARIEAEFSAYFLNSSLSLMAAYAIMVISQIRLARRGEAELPHYVEQDELTKDDSDDIIGFWGVDMSASEEYCVAPETKVLTADLRWVRADALNVGDRVMAFDEEKGGGLGSPTYFRQWKVGVVEAAPRLTRPCYEIDLEDGTTLVASAEHRWLTYAEHENRWCRTDRLLTSTHREGKPTRLVKLTDTWEENRSWDAGYLAAAFDGEGHIGQRDRSNCNGRSMALGFGQRQNAMSTEVMAACERLGFTLSGGADEKVVNADFGECHNYRILGGRPEILKFLGSIRPRRLLANFDPSRLGVMHRKDAVAVKALRPIGEREVIGLATSARTFVAEGFASHNSRQKPGCWFFGLEIMRRGIGLYYPPESDLFCPEPVYGICEWDHNYCKATARMREINQRMQANQQTAANIQAQMNADAGAKDDMSYFIKNFMSPYAVPPGVVNRMIPGTGLGVTVLTVDGKPAK